MEDKPLLKSKTGRKLFLNSGKREKNPTLYSEKS